MASHDVKPETVFDRYHFSAFKSSAIVELVGTFLFVVTIPMATMANEEMSPLAFGMMLMALVFSFGYISGGHFNPVVSLAAFIGTSQFGKAKLFVYLVSQALGAAGAAFYCVLIHGANFPVPEIAFDVASIVRAFLVESTFSFILCSIILHVQYSKQKDNDFYGFAVGMAYVAASLCVGGLSGGIFNPAAASGLIVVRCLTTYCTPVLHLWVYWAGSVVGAIFASIIYIAVNNSHEVTA